MWTTLLEMDDFLSRPICSIFHSLCDFISMGLYLSTSGNLDEAIEGAGGSRIALASLVIKHINRVLDQPGDASKENALRAVMKVLGQGWGHMPGEDIVFHNALLGQGLITALTSAAGLLSRAPFNGESISLHYSLALLFFHLRSSPGHMWIVQSLSAGLLNVIMACRHRTPDQTVTVLAQIIGVLNISLVHRSVLLQLKISLTQLEYPGNTVVHPDLGDEWGKFLELARQRLGILNEQEGHPLRRMCDNVKVRSTPSMTSVFLTFSLEVWNCIGQGRLPTVLWMSDFTLLFTRLSKSRLDWRTSPRL
jgi:hypothetical protein